MQLSGNPTAAANAAAELAESVAASARAGEAEGGPPDRPTGRHRPFALAPAAASCTVRDRGGRVGSDDSDSGGLGRRLADGRPRLVLPSGSGEPLDKERYASQTSGFSEGVRRGKWKRGRTIRGSRAERDNWIVKPKAGKPMARQPRDNEKESEI